MRHIREIPVSIGSNHYAVSPKVVAEVEALLRQARARALHDHEREWYTAEELYPEMFDPVKGPAKYLRGIRMREGLTQTELAKKMGIKQSHISEMERCKRPIGKAMAKKFAKVLNANWQCFLS